MRRVTVEAAAWPPRYSGSGPVPLLEPANPTGPTAPTSPAPPAAQHPLPLGVHAGGFAPTAQGEPNGPGQRPTILSDFSTGFKKALYWMGLEWVPWPHHAVMDSARLGQIALASHHLVQAETAALRVAKDTRCLLKDPRLTLRARSAAANAAREIVLRPSAAAGAVAEAVETRAAAHITRITRQAKPVSVWRPWSWFGPTKAKILVNQNQTAESLLSYEQLSRIQADGLRATKLEAAVASGAEAGLKKTNTLAAGLVPSIAQKSSTLARVGRVAARWTTGLQFVFSVHDAVRSRKIAADPKASRAKKILAHVTAWMSGIAVFAPMIPTPYKWPIASAAALIGAVTGTARDIVK